MITAISLTRAGSKPTTSSQGSASSPKLKRCECCAAPFVPRKGHAARFCSRKCFHEATKSPRETRKCQWCGEAFQCNVTQQPQRRFCSERCSARWRATQPALMAELLSAETREKSRTGLLRFFAANSPRAQAARARIGALKLMRKLAARRKLSAMLRAMGHRPPIHGGNGSPMPQPQALLWRLLGAQFVAEWPVTIPTRDGRPQRAHYLIDLADRDLKLAVEVDGICHHSPQRRAHDRRKDRILRQLGWTVLRFSNQAILDSASSVVEQIKSACTILQSQGTRRSA